MKKSCVIIFILLLVCGVIGCFGHSQRMVSRKDESKTIRIAGFSSPRFLEEAARKFERKNPGLKVEIDAYASPEMLKQGDLLKMDEEYRSSLNTQLMSGKGADIIYVNGLPYKRYIDRHMFTDLHQLMKADPNYDAGKYYTNIFDAVEIDDSLYTLPIDYCYDLLSSNIKMNLNDRSWNWQEFFDSAQNEIKGRDLYILPGSDEGLFHKIFWEDYSHFVNENSKTARFDSKEFVNLLKQCKGLSDHNYVAKSSQGIAEEAGKQTLFQYCEGIWTWYSLALSQGYLYRVPSDDPGSYSFTAELFAINDASPNKAAAWEFLKFLISDEMQVSSSIGFPVNRAASKEKYAMEIKQFCNDKSVNLPRKEKIDLMQRYAPFNESMANQLKVYRYEDPQIMKIVNPEIHRFFTGNTSAEEAARVIQNKVSIYLEE